jgi:hypothetical protein
MSLDDLHDEVEGCHLLKHSFRKEEVHWKRVKVCDGRTMVSPSRIFMLMVRLQCHTVSLASSHRLMPFSFPRIHNEMSVSAALINVDTYTGSLHICMHAVKYAGMYSCVRPPLMAGIEKDHWLRNTRANDTGSIVDVSLSLINSRPRGAFYDLRHN